LITPLQRVLIKLFSKVCGQAFFEKGCDHAVDRVFDQTFFKRFAVKPFLKRVVITPLQRVLIKLFSKVCGQAFFEKGCDHAAARGFRF
jgi:uncharacterized protein (DUF697 family)